VKRKSIRLGKNLAIKAGNQLSRGERPSDMQRAIEILHSLPRLLGRMKLGKNLPQKRKGV
jgi:hypothetical protein